MLSLKKNIDGLDREEQRVQALLDCYVSALHSLRDQALDPAAGATPEFQSGVDALDRDLRENNYERSALQKSRLTLLELLRAFRQRTEDALASREEDLRAISGATTSATPCASRNPPRVQMVARGTDLGKMRLALTREVTEFKSATESMCRENQFSVENMQERLADFKRRLESAENRAAIDALTGAKANFASAKPWHRAVP